MKTFSQFPVLAALITAGCQAASVQRLIRRQAETGSQLTIVDSISGAPGDCPTDHPLLQGYDFDENGKVTGRKCAQIKLPEGYTSLKLEPEPSDSDAPTKQQCFVAVGINSNGDLKCAAPYLATDNGLLISLSHDLLEPKTANQCTDGAFIRSGNHFLNQCRTLSIPLVQYEAIQGGHVVSTALTVRDMANSNCPKDSNGNPTFLTGIECESTTSCKNPKMQCTSFAYGSSGVKMAGKISEGSETYSSNDKSFHEYSCINKMFAVGMGCRGDQCRVKVPACSRLELEVGGETKQIVPPNSSSDCEWVTASNGKTLCPSNTFALNIEINEKNPQDRNNTRIYCCKAYIISDPSAAKIDETFVEEHKAISDYFMKFGSDHVAGEITRLTDGKGQVHRKCGAGDLAKLPFIKMLETKSTHVRTACSTKREIDTKNSFFISETEEIKSVQVNNGKENVRLCSPGKVVTEVNLDGPITGISIKCSKVQIAFGSNNETIEFEESETNEGCKWEVASIGCKNDRYLRGFSTVSGLTGKKADTGITKFNYCCKIKVPAAKKAEQQTHGSNKQKTPSSASNKQSDLGVKEDTKVFQLFGPMNNILTCFMEANNVLVANPDPNACQKENLATNFKLGSAGALKLNNKFLHINPQTLSLEITQDKTQRTNIQLAKNSQGKDVSKNFSDGKCLFVATDAKLYLGDCEQPYPQITFIV